MNYFRYIFSDKNALPYWIIFYIIILLTFTSYALINPKNLEDPAFYLLFLILMSIHMLFYYYSYINYKTVIKFLKKYENRIKNNSLIKRKVEISQESYYITAFKTNHFAKINPEVKKDEFLTALIDDYIVIMGKSYAFGIIKEDLKPIIVALNGEPIKDFFEHAKIPQNYSVKIDDNYIEIVFLSSPYSINKIKIENVITY